MFRSVSPSPCLQQVLASTVRSSDHIVACSASFLVCSCAYCSFSSSFKQFFKFNFLYLFPGHSLAHFVMTDTVSLLFEQLVFGWPKATANCELLTMLTSLMMPVVLKEKY